MSWKVVFGAGGQPAVGLGRVVVDAGDAAAEADHSFGEASLDPGAGQSQLEASLPGALEFAVGHRLHLHHLERDVRTLVEFGTVGQQRFDEAVTVQGLRGTVVFVKTAKGREGIRGQLTGILSEEVPLEAIGEERLDGFSVTVLQCSGEQRQGAISEYEAAEVLGILQVLEVGVGEHRGCGRGGQQSRSAQSAGEDQHAQGIASQLPSARSGRLGSRGLCRIRHQVMRLDLLYAQYSDPVILPGSLCALALPDGSPSS